MIVIEANINESSIIMKWNEKPSKSILMKPMKMANIRNERNHGVKKNINNEKWPWRESPVMA